MHHLAVFSLLFSLGLLAATQTAAQDFDLPLRINMGGRQVTDSNGNVWLGKDEFRQVVQYFFDNFDDIIFREGVGHTSEESCGFFAGSVYPPNEDPNEISIVGTWTPTHRETGKKIYNKYFAIIRFNQAGKIDYCSEFFDASGIQVQLETEA